MASKILGLVEFVSAACATLILGITLLGETLQDQQSITQFISNVGVPTAILILGLSMTAYILKKFADIIGPKLADWLDAQIAVTKTLREQTTANALIDERTAARLDVIEHQTGTILAKIELLEKSYNGPNTK